MLLSLFVFHLSHFAFGKNYNYTIIAVIVAKKRYKKVRKENIFGGHWPKRLARFIEHYMSRLMGKPTVWFPNSSDTNRPVQAQKNTRGLKFWLYVEEILYYPSENKGADQLRSYRKADLCLCFRISRLLVFS